MINFRMLSMSWGSIPSFLQAACISCKIKAAPLLGLFHKIEIRVALGNASFNSASRLPAMSVERVLIPVTLAFRPRQISHDAGLYRIGNSDENNWNIGSGSLRSNRGFDR
jgi:hypothetical protein